MTVTDEDREAVIGFKYFTPGHGRELAKAFARHRMTARRKALEDAAMVVESGMFNSRGQAQPALAAKLRAMIEGGAP